MTSNIRMRENWYRDLWLTLVTMGVILALASVSHTVKTNCQQIEVVKSGLRLTLLEGQQFAATSRVRNQLEKQAIGRFYDDALGRERPRKC